MSTNVITRHCPTCRIEVRLHTVTDHCDRCRRHVTALNNAKWRDLNGSTSCPDGHDHTVDGRTISLDVLDALDSGFNPF